MAKYTPLIAEPHTPPYKIHKYFARRPWNVFFQLVKIYSKEMDIVLDPFMGGGVTILESLKQNRNVIGLDLNPLSKFIVRNMVKKSENEDELNLIANELFEYIKYLYSDFDTVEIESVKHPILWNELTFTVYCNYCGQKTKLSNDNKVSNGKYKCGNPNCSSNINSIYIQPKNCERVGYEYLFAVVSNSEKSKDKIHITYDYSLSKQLNDHINHLEVLIKDSNIEIPKNKIPLDWDRQHEDLLEKKNIKYFEDFFTKRNLYINLLLKKKINSINNQNIRDIFRLVFSSSLRDTNLMAFTSNSWQSGSPTTWSKHAYWIPSQFCEVNVLNAFQRAYSRMKASLIYNSSIDLVAEEKKEIKDLKQNKNSFVLLSDSISEISIPENSVDAIITDPPYGSNVQYLELSHFWYVWNKDLYETKSIDFKKEAVSNRKKNFKGAKNTQIYCDNLYSVFSKCYKVLKPDKQMVLTFNNKDMGSWLAIIISIMKSGFTFTDMFFQDGVKNYKQTAHTKYQGSPYGDYIYVFTKNTGSRHSSKNELGLFTNENFLIEEIDKIFKQENQILEVKSSTQTIDMFKKIIPVISSYILKNGEVTEKTFKHFHKKKLENV